MKDIELNNVIILFLAGLEVSALQRLQPKAKMNSQGASSETCSRGCTTGNEALFLGDL